MNYLGILGEIGLSCERYQSLRFKLIYRQKWIKLLCKIED